MTDYFTGPEREAVEGLSGADRSVLTTLVWSGKEAVFSTLGLSSMTTGRELPGTAKYISLMSKYPEGRTIANQIPFPPAMRW